jgi:hypothetical protein
MAKKSKKRVRVIVRLPDDLVRWAKTYARKKDKTFTGVVVWGLTLLRMSEDRHGKDSVAR